MGLGRSITERASRRRNAGSAGLALEEDRLGFHVSPLESTGQSFPPAHTEVVADRPALGVARRRSVLVQRADRGSVVAHAGVAASVVRIWLVGGSGGPMLPLTSGVP
jgi:hypothetical protein